MMHRKYGLLSLFFVFFIILPLVSADGGFFRPRVYYTEDLFEPTQKAIILHDGSEETLIIEAMYKGDITNFAWVIPVPSYPYINKTSPYIFEELHYLTEPDYRRGPSMGFGLMETMSMASGKGVDILEQKQVGVYETTLLTSDDPKAMIDWLNNNQYYVSPESEEVLDYYIEKRWYFIAARINLAPYDEKLLNSLKIINPLIRNMDDAEGLLTEQLVTYVKTERTYDVLGAAASVVLDYDNDTDENIGKYPYSPDANPKPTHLITEIEYEQAYERYNGYFYDHMRDVLSVALERKYTFDAKYPDYYSCANRYDYNNDYDLTKCVIWNYTKKDPQFKILDGVDCGDYCELISASKQQYSIDDLSQVAAYVIANGNEEVAAYFSVNTIDYDWYDTKDDKEDRLKSVISGKLRAEKRYPVIVAEQAATSAWISKYSTMTGASASHDAIIGYIMSRTMDDFESDKSYVDSYANQLGFMSTLTYDDLKSKYRGDNDEYALRTTMQSQVREVLTWKQQAVMGSLGEGNLQPLLIKFDSTEIIYPLKISSVNGGVSEVLLYVFAKYRTQIDDDKFGLEYAKWIEKEDIKTASYDAYALRLASGKTESYYYHSNTYYYTNQLLDDRYFLTKFRAELWPKEMEDLYITPAPNNKAYILKVYSNDYVWSWIAFILGLLMSLGVMFGIGMLCRWFNNRFVKDRGSLFFVSIKRLISYLMVLPALFISELIANKLGTEFLPYIFDNFIGRAVGDLIDFLYKLLHLLYFPDFLIIILFSILIILSAFYIIHLLAVAILSMWRNLAQQGISGVMDWNKVWKLALFTAISVMVFLFIIYAIADALQIKNFKTIFFLTGASVLMVVIPNIIWNLIMPRFKK